MTAPKRVKAPAKARVQREPTEQEKRAMATARESFHSRPARPICSLTVDEHKRAARLDAGHNDLNGFECHLRDSLGSRSPGFTAHLMNRICNAMTPLGGGMLSEDSVNAAVAIVAAIAPRDEVEAVLGAQIAATNDLSLELIAHAKGSKNVDVTASYIAQATKLQRTMCVQLETLSKMRRGGEQIVRHIHVDNRGGQAVIAENVHTAGGLGNGKTDINAMSKARAALRCLAKNRSGTPCQCPAMKGKRRCRLHGGKNPGPPRGNKNALKHGLRSADHRLLKRRIAELLKASEGLLKLNR